MKATRYFLFTVLFSVSSIAGAQPTGGWNMPSGYMVMGVTLDSASKKPINMGVTSLIDEITGNSVDGGLTDSTGRIFFMVQKPGLYRVQITAVGYGVYKSEAFALNDSLKMKKLGMIFISNHSVISMEGAEIVANRPLIESKVDKLIYNASQDITSKGGSATDLLRKVPMVEVDLDGNVSIRGSSNIRVLINGKPSGIVSASVKDAMQSIPSDQIERVEVITNPSAKYDAEGTAGIINIVLKESKMKGTTGNIHSGAGNRSGNLGAGVATQFGKTGLSLRMGGFYWRNVGDGEIDRYNTYGNTRYRLLQQSENRTFGGGPYSSIGIDREINKYTSFSLAGTLRGNWNRTKSSWETKTGIADSTLNLLYGRSTRNFTLTLGYDITADIRRTFKKKGRELGFSAQYNGGSSKVDYSAVQNDANSVENYRERSNNLGLNNEFTAQIDFTEPINKNVNLESGIKAIKRRVTSGYSFDSFSYLSHEYSSITARSNQFYYYQNVGGAYSQVTWQFHKDYSLRIGGRYEYTLYGGGREDSSISFDGKPYGNLIPFININRKFGYAGFLKFNYTQRLLRPSLFYLNPYTNFSDPRSLTTGNPYLRAEVSNNFEISAGKYTQKGGGNFNIYHRRTSNAIESIRNVDSFGIYRTTYGNVGSNSTTGFDMNVNLTGKKYMVNFNGGLSYVTISSNQSTGVVAGLTNSGISYSAGLWGYYKFHKLWTVESFARINAPTFSLQGRTQNWYFHTVGIKRRFKNDKGGIGLGIDNPFTPHVTYTTVQEGPDFSYRDVREINMLGVRLNFDYRFGKIEFEQPKKPKKGITNDDLKQGDSQQQGN